MNGKHLFEGMSYVDERYIDEAETKAFPRKYWTNAATLAACLCLILLGLYQPLSPAVTEGAPETTMACAANPGDGIAAGMIPESMELNPEEVPAVILIVEELTDDGFRGTVTELVATDVFAVGMELNVVVTENAEPEAAQPGSTVVVQFISYEEATQTITVDLILESKG